MNKGKRSFAVDVRTPEGQALVTELITAPGPDRGVFLSNFPESGWLSDERLRAHREDLIYVNILGNPDGGTAVDYTVNPASGFAYATGPAGGSLPTNHVLPAWDIATGLTAACGLLAAERHRTRHGAGQLVTVALADVAFTMVANLGYLAQAQLLGEDRPPIGNDMYGAFGRDFPTGDGRRVMVVAISHRQWQNARARPPTSATTSRRSSRSFDVDLSEEGDRFRARDVLAALIAPWIAARPLADDRRGVRPRRRVLGRLPDVPPAARGGLAGVGRQPDLPRHRSARPRQRCASAARRCTSRRSTGEAPVAGAAAGRAHRSDPRARTSDSRIGRSATSSTVASSPVPASGCHERAQRAHGGRATAREPDVDGVRGASPRVS